MHSRCMSSCLLGLASAPNTAACIAKRCLSWFMRPLLHDFAILKLWMMSETHSSPGMMGPMVYGGIETGGTNVRCIIGSGPDDVVAERRFPTTTPEATIENMVAFFKENATAHPVESIGVAAFGPLDLDETSSTYGSITDTPKPGWSGIDLCRPLTAALEAPVTMDTDVNAAALAEYLWGTGAPSGESDQEPARPDPLLYLTVGTGIGLGVITAGRPLHGLVHPEAGHMHLPRNHMCDPFEGSCPFHGDCWEGLASGTAIEARWGQSGDTIPPDHPAWDLEAHYLGLGIADLIYCFSPRLLVLGGGVMNAPGLLDRVKLKVRAAMRGYLRTRPPLEHIDDILVAPRLGDRAGLLGALALAMQP